VQAITRWETLYREDARVLTAPPSRAVMRAADCFAAARAQRLLDLGCGAGRDTRFLAERGFAVVGVDASLAGLALAQRAAPHLPLLLADARQLPLATASVDGVYCFGLLHEFTGPTADTDMATILTETRRVLGPGGTLILAVLAGEPEDGLPHVRLFTRAMLETALRAFTMVACELLDDVGCTGREGYRVWWAQAS
jgi:SAM-dependent methyltransferase